MRTSRPAPTSSVDASATSMEAAAPTDTYRVTATSPLRGVTAIRLEALPDPRLPQNGPGRADNGNFALTRLTLAHAPKSNRSQVTPVELHSPVASAEQPGWGPAGLLDERNDTGWAIEQYTGRPVAVTLQTRALVPGGDDTLLLLTLEQQSQFPKHEIGRFRVWATNALVFDKGGAAHITVRVTDLACREGELVDHAGAVEPVAVAVESPLEPGGPHAQQSAG